MDPHRLVVAHELAALSHEAKPDLPAAGGPGQPHLGQARAEVEDDERGVFDAVVVLERPHGRLHRPGIPEHRAELIEDVGPVVDEDPAPGEGAVGAPGRRPVGVSLVGLGAVDLVFGQVDPPEAEEQPLDRLPLGREVILVAGLEHDGGPPDCLRDALRVGQARRQRLLADHVHAPPGGFFDQAAMAERRRADVAEIQRLPLQRLFGAGVGRRSREEGSRRFEVGRRQVGHGDDVHRLPQDGVLRPLRGMSPQGDVAGAEEGPPQPHRQPPSRATRPRTSSRMPSADSAVSRSIERAGFTRKCGL